MELTKEAKRALVDTDGRVGAAIPLFGMADVIAELFSNGLMTRAGNLTRKGTIVRQRVLDEMLEAL